VTRINRPLTDPERSLLMALGARTIAEQAPGGCSHDEAYDVLTRLAAEGELVLDGDFEDVHVYTYGNLLVEAKRDWLAFHAAHPGNDPWSDNRRPPDASRQDD
jgi:hypothetical protein